MKKNTIIFDLDGTLLNTLEDLQVSFNYALKCFGFSEKSLEEIKNCVGSGIRTAIERALPYKIEEDKIEKIVSYFKMYYKEHMHEKTFPYKGIINLLDKLTKNGYKLAVVSNKYDDAVKFLTKKYFDKYIKTAVGEGYGISKKPSCDGIIKVLKELNSNIEDAIYIGDSDIDIKTAKNAKIPCISVLWGYKDKEFLIKSGAEIFAQTAEDLYKIIENY